MITLRARAPRGRVLCLRLTPGQKWSIQFDGWRYPRNVGRQMPHIAGQLVYSRSGIAPSRHPICIMSDLNVKRASPTHFQ